MTRESRAGTSCTVRWHGPSREGQNQSQLKVHSGRSCIGGISRCDRTGACRQNSGLLSRTHRWCVQTHQARTVGAHASLVCISWAHHWKQSVGSDDPHMLYKELVAPVVSTLLLAPMLKRQVLCCALDNAGVAFTINKLSCGCERSLGLLQPFSDSLSRGRFAVVAGHAHRVHNSHTDNLSHSLCGAMWSQVASDAPVKKPHRAELHFAVLDVKTGECFVGTMSFEDPYSKRATKLAAVAAACGSKPDLTSPGTVR